MIIAISFTLFFIVLRFTVTLFNFISNPKLTRVSRQYHDLVSVLIPARNEEENILRLLESIHQQDYKGYEVIVYDDLSTDKTYQVVSAFVEKHHNFKVIKGTDLPYGWTGKNYACHQLAEKASGEYFLFLDADTTISDNLINSSVHRMQLFKLGLLSLFPTQNMNTIGEKVTVPLLNYLLLNLLPLRFVYLFKTPAMSVACGQFMLFDGAAYQQNQWHQMVKDKVVEDAEIMKLLKGSGYNGEVLLANKMIKCRMYKNFNDAISGFSKNSLALFNYNISALLVFVLIMIGGPLIVIMTLNISLIFFMIGLIALSRVMIALSAGENVFFNIVLHPAQMINLAVIAFLSIQKHLTRTNVWKGRCVD